MDDVEYIREILWPEFLAQFTSDNAEYPGDRPLGAKAEWHGIHRKVGKLKAPLWDDKPWTGRESVRRMLQEIIGHAFLAIASLDEVRSPENYPPQHPWLTPEATARIRRERDEAETAVRPPKDIPDLLRHNMSIDLAHPNLNPLIGMTEEGKTRLRRLRGEAAGQAQMDPPIDHPV